MLFDITLKIIDNPATSVQQKFITAQLMKSVSKNIQILADFYYNFDCNMDVSNIFARMTNSLSKIAQNTKNTQLSSIGLSSLVIISNSLKEWCSELYETESNNVES